MLTLLMALILEEMQFTPSIWDLTLSAIFLNFSAEISAHPARPQTHTRYRGPTSTVRKSKACRILRVLNVSLGNSGMKWLS